ncbi:MAG TPA: helix-turn-helix transcriptional regulator [Rudaea sp.]|nr:helix-turn-helix transcriptional regulator [Rudaea sp.]
MLKEEISRLCRKEIRRQVVPLRSAATAYRRDIAALKRRLAEAERRAKALAKSQSASGTETAAGGGEERPMRFVAKGLHSMRTRLGLSAAEFAKLIEVSPQSVYNWEHKKSTPRKEQLARIVGLRALGKREAKSRLEALAAPRGRRRSRSRPQRGAAAA